MDAKAASEEGTKLKGVQGPQLISFSCRKFLVAARPAGHSVPNLAHPNLQ